MTLKWLSWNQLCLHWVFLTLSDSFLLSLTLFDSVGLYLTLSCLVWFYTILFVCVWLCGWLFNLHGSSCSILINFLSICLNLLNFGWISLTHAVMHKFCACFLIYAIDMSELCLKYAWDMSEIFQRYIWDMPYTSNHCKMVRIVKFEKTWVSEWVSIDVTFREAVASKNQGYPYNGWFIAIFASEKILFWKLIKSFKIKLQH